MKDKLIFFFRHGETDWNLNGRLQGHADIPLNSTGEEQAKALADRLAYFQLEHIFSSDLKRALKTAEIVAQTNATPISSTDKLRECCLGEVEGFTLEELKKRCPEEEIQFWRRGAPSDLDFAFPGGESKRQMLERVLAFLEEELTKISAINIGVSAHGGVISKLLFYLNANNLSKEIRVENCSFYIFSYNTDTKIWRQES